MIRLVGFEDLERVLVVLVVLAKYLVVLVVLERELVVLAALLVLVGLVVLDRDPEEAQMEVLGPTVDVIVALCGQAICVSVCTGATTQAPPHVPSQRFSWCLCAEL